QQAFADYNRNEISRAVKNQSNMALGKTFPPDRFFSIWDGGFNLAWEIDFWGRFRRAIESADAALDASVEDYDDVLVTLIADIASTYVTYRTLQERLVLVHKNIEDQEDVVRKVADRDKAGQGDPVDLPQLQSNLRQTRSLVPALEVSLRQANNQ